MMKLWERVETEVKEWDKHFFKTNLVLSWVAWPLKLFIYFWGLHYRDCISAVTFGLFPSLLILVIPALKLFLFVYLILNSHLIFILAIFTRLLWTSFTLSAWEKWWFLSRTKQPNHTQPVPCFHSNRHHCGQLHNSCPKSSQKVSIFSNCNNIPLLSFV